MQIPCLQALNPTSTPARNHDDMIVKYGRKRASVSAALRSRSRARRLRYDTARPRCRASRPAPRRLSRMPVAAGRLWLGGALDAAEAALGPCARSRSWAWPLRGWRQEDAGAARSRCAPGEPLGSARVGMRWPPERAGPPRAEGSAALGPQRVLPLAAVSWEHARPGAPEAQQRRPVTQTPRPAWAPATQRPAQYFAATAARAPARRAALRAGASRASRHHRRLPSTRAAGRPARDLDFPGSARNRRGLARARHRAPSACRRLLAERIERGYRVPARTGSAAICPVAAHS